MKNFISLSFLFALSIYASAQTKNKEWRKIFGKPIEFTYVAESGRCKPTYVLGQDTLIPDQRYVVKLYPIRTTVSPGKCQEFMRKENCLFVDSGVFASVISYNERWVPGQIPRFSQIAFLGETNSLMQSTDVDCVFPIVHMRESYYGSSNWYWDKHLLSVPIMGKNNYLFLLYKV